MPIPTHSSFCISRAFTTFCPDCRDTVFFFSCNCGSKVYFNDLGEPWPIHRCRNRLVREAIEMLRLNDRLSHAEVYARVDVLAKERGFEIPQEVLEMLEVELGRRKKPFKIISVADLSGFADVSGKVMQVNRQVSFRSRLNIDLENPMHAALAGDLLKHEYAEVIIRESPDKNNCSIEFTVYLKSSLLRGQQFPLGKTLLANIAPLKNELRRLWEISEFKGY